MTVRPTVPGSTSRTDITRTGKSPSPASGRMSARPDHTTPPAGERRDQMEISSQARALQGLGGSEPVAAGAVDDTRMREVSRRLADGHYDRPEVVQQILERILNDL